MKYYCNLQDCYSKRPSPCLLCLLYFLVLVRRSGIHHDVQSYSSVTLTSDKTPRYSILEVHSLADSVLHGTPTVTAASVCTGVCGLLFGHHEGCILQYVAFTFTSADEKEDTMLSHPRHNDARINNIS